MVLADMHLKPGTPWEYCPRETLRRVSKILQYEFNMIMNAGFENEFFLLRSVQVDGKGKWVPFDATPYCSSATTDDAFPVLSEIVHCLESLNIVVEQLHAEAGNGQFEFAFGYTNCENAADNIVFAHEVIRAVARKHGLLATFVPKFSLDDIGSGSHVHLSLSGNGENVFMGSIGENRYGLSKVGEEFMAGVLDHLPSILAFTAPVPNSYDRIQPNTWSGAYLCWGMENREAPLRAACPPGTPDGSISNFEIKVFDGCANPHLGLASIMAAGIDGIRRHLTLPEPIDDNPDNLKDKVRRLPKSLYESVEALEGRHSDARFDWRKAFGCHYIYCLVHIFSNESFFDMLSSTLILILHILNDNLEFGFKYSFLAQIKFRFLVCLVVLQAEIKFYSENKDAWKNLIYKY